MELRPTTRQILAGAAVVAAAAVLAPGGIASAAPGTAVPPPPASSPTGSGPTAPGPTAWPPTVVPPSATSPTGAPTTSPVKTLPPITTPPPTLPPTTCGLVTVDRATLVQDPAGPARRVLLVVSGWNPSPAYTDRLVPLVYVRQPAYWGVRAEGCGPKYGAPPAERYTVTLDVTSTLGTLGVEVIGSNRTIQLPLRPTPTTLPPSSTVPPPPSTTVNGPSLAP